MRKIGRSKMQIHIHARRKNENTKDGKRCFAEYDFFCFFCFTENEIITSRTVLSFSLVLYYFVCERLLI